VETHGRFHAEFAKLLKRSTATWSDCQEMAVGNAEGAQQSLEGLEQTAAARTEQFLHCGFLAWSTTSNRLSKINQKSAKGNG
jgi:hypothetical protein